MNAKFKCHNCNAEVTIKKFINSCKYSYKAQKWFWYETPCCNEMYMAEVKNQFLKIGNIDGAPGPCLIPELEMNINNLIVNEKEDGLELQYGEYLKLIPKKN